MKCTDQPDPIALEEGRNVAGLFQQVFCPIQIVASDLILNPQTDWELGRSWN